MVGEQIDLTALSDDDVDDEDALRQAIALSLQDQEMHELDSEQLNEESPEPKAESAGGVAFGSLVLDRKAMEEERLKRLAGKRPRSSTDPEEGLPISKKAAVASRETKRTVELAFAQQPKECIDRGSGIGGNTLQFSDGVVKKTWARGYSRQGDDIKIEEILQKDKLQLAIISSYQWDDEWMMSKVEIGRTKLLLVAYAADDTQQQDMMANAPPNVKFSFPSMNGRGAMHSKLQVLKFPTHVRIVVPTGNMVPYDWGETGVMENMVFLIDLPRLTDSAAFRNTQFSSELTRFLKACQVDGKLVDSLKQYDFSRTERLGFVHTIPGGHTDQLRRYTGYCGLGTCVSSLGLGTEKPIDVDIVCASLGAINTGLVEAMYNACQGDVGMKEYTERTTRKASATGPSQTLRDHLRIYFPTDQTIASSRGGRGAAGTICVQPKWWRSPSFPTALFRDCVSKLSRTGILHHSKVIFVRGVDGSKPWAYVGSANLSESAWGRLVMDKKSSKPKLTCRNWECGIVMPVPVSAVDADPAPTSTRRTKGTATATAASDLDATFSATVPVPMLTPGRPYSPNEEPWFYSSAP